MTKGYKQTEGLDYSDTYSPLTRINSITMVLTIAALRNLKVHQMNVKTTFLNGELEEESTWSSLKVFLLRDKKRKFVNW